MMVDSEAVDIGPRVRAQVNPAYRAPVWATAAVRRAAGSATG